jgi:hypothetical protein
MPGRQATAPISLTQASACFTPIPPRTVSIPQYFEFKEKNYWHGFFMAKFRREFRQPFGEGHMKRFRLVSAGVGVLAALTLTLSAHAVPIPSGSFYTDVVGGGIGDVVVTTGGGASANVGDPSGRNDDGFRGPIPLGFTLDYFGTSYTDFWANNNGNISFGSGVSSFTPNPLDTTTSAPMIAPYWADVDTRGTDSGVMHFRNFSGQEQIAVTWPGVGYFSANDDLLAYFQLILRGPNFSVPSDEGQIGFFYKTVDWETGDASGGSGGFGGTEATVGFGDGLSDINSGEISLAGSQQAGISDEVENEHFWFNLSESGVPEQTVPTPGTMALLTLGLIALAGLRRKTMGMEGVTANRR